jgi:hypothetical protein
LRKDASVQWQTSRKRSKHQLYTERGTSSLPGSCRPCVFWPFFGVPVTVPAIDLLLDFCAIRHRLQQQLCSQIMLGPTKPKDLGAWSYPLLGHLPSNQISKVDMIMAAITQSTILDHVAALTVRPKKAWAIGCPKPKPKWRLPICWSLFSPLPVGSQYNLGVFLFQFYDIECLVNFSGKRKENIVKFTLKKYLSFGQKTRNNCWKRNIQFDPYPMFILKFPWPFLIVENNVKIIVNLTVVT